MLDLSLLGVQDATPQLLLGSAGAVIGFGTSWALSRFGVRPTIEQGNLVCQCDHVGHPAGFTIYGGSGADNYKLKYGSLVVGEMAGMAVGVWSARRWTWTGPQIVMADSLFLGTAMVAFGMNRLRYETPRITPAAAIPVWCPRCWPRPSRAPVDTLGRRPGADGHLGVGGRVAGIPGPGSGLAEGELASRWGQGAC